ncbi:hypothetical protein AAIB41_07915 [Brucella sp. BE17]|uniref:hypothetical protein n=1 Tax=Brucella sp. BE17 TaxID=3142977 RepID=UPI0031BA589C
MAFAIAPFIAILKRYRQRQDTRRRFVRANRLLDHLPEDLRKDMGWPERYLECIPKSVKQFSEKDARKTDRAKP